MTIALTVIHIVIASTLILFILLHAGRGGGLSDMFGGGMTSGGSTVVEKNLDRMTVIMTVIFTITTIALHLRLA